MLAALAETLRLSADARERRAALRSASPQRETVEGLIEEARSWRRRDPQSAMRIARSALVLARAGKATELAAEAAQVLGQAEALIGRPRHALRRQRMAALGIRADLRASVAVDTAASLILLGHETEARSALADGRRLAKGRNRVGMLAVIDVTEANLLMRLDRDADALVFYARARRVAARRKRMTVLASIDTNRATALANLHRYEAADRMYARAARTYARMGDDATAMITEYNRAYLQYLRGRFQRAVQELTDLQTRFARNGNERQVALCDLDLAEIRLRLDEPAKAASHARAAMDTLTRLGFAPDAARARLFFAVAERGLGRRDESRRALESARDALRDVGCIAWEAVALQRLADVDAEDGILERALRRAHEAAARLLDLGLLERGGRAEVLAARIELARGDATAARARLASLWPRLRGLHSPWLTSEFHRESARAAEASGRLPSAVRHALEAVRVLDAHRAVVPADESLRHFRRERAIVREEAVRLLLSVGGRNSAQRALALARAAKRAESVGHAPRGKRRREARDLADAIDGLLGRMPTDDPHRRAGVARRIADVAARKDKRLRTLLGSDARPAAGAPAAEALPADTTVVEWFAATKETLAFVSVGSRVTARHLPISRARWLEASRAWNGEDAAADLEADPDADAGPAAAPRADAREAAGGSPDAAVRAWLRDAVAEPLRAWVQTPRLLLVLDDVLARLPLLEVVRAAIPLEAEARSTPPG